MTRSAFQRDNILSDEERAASARKCIALLVGLEDEMSQKDVLFFRDQRALARSIRYAPSEPQLQWLRDIVERVAH